MQIDFKNPSPIKNVLGSTQQDKKVSRLNDDIRRASEDARPISYRKDIENNTIDDGNIQNGQPNASKNMSSSLILKDQNNLVVIQQKTKKTNNKGIKIGSTNQNTYNSNADMYTDSTKREDLSGIIIGTKEKFKDKDKEKINEKEIYVKNNKTQQERSKRFLKEIGESNFLPQLSSIDYDAEREKDHHGINSHSLEFVALDIDSGLPKNKDKAYNNFQIAPNGINSNNNNNANPNSNQNNIFNEYSNLKMLSKLPLISNKSTINTNQNVKNSNNNSIGLDGNPRPLIRKKIARGGAIKNLLDYPLGSDPNDINAIIANNSTKISSLSPANIKNLQNQLAGGIPTVQGNTLKLQRKNKQNTPDLRIRDQNNAVSGQNNYEGDGTSRKDDDLDLIGNNATKLILNKKGTPLNSDGKIHTQEDEKNTSFVYNGINQDPKSQKKSNRYGVGSIKEMKSTSVSGSNNPNTQANTIEMQKDNENPETISNTGFDKVDRDKEGDTPLKKSGKANAGPGSNLSSTKSVNMVKIQVATKKNPNITTISQNKMFLDQKAKDLDPLFASKLTAYKDWMLKINFSFNVIVKQPLQANFTPYKYFIGKGNNSILVKTLMKQRWWWIPADLPTDPNVNLLWTQLKQNPFLELLKQKKKNTFDSLDLSTNSTMADTLSERNNESATDQSDSDYEIGAIKPNKASKTMNNLKSSKRSNGKKKSEGDKLTKDINNLHRRIMNKIDTSMMLNYLANKRKSSILEDEEELIKFNRRQGASVIIDQPNNLKMHNHIENNFHLSNKKAMFYNMRNYCDAMKRNVFDNLPLTFHIQNGIDDAEYKKFLEYYQNKEKEIQEQEEQNNKNPNEKKNIPNNKKIRNIWIVKPGENTNRGHGITVCNELNQIKEIISSNEIHPNGKKKTYIVQQYIDRPLLYNKRKFDIRCYMMITSVNGIMRGIKIHLLQNNGTFFVGYWYQDGYIRTASKEFTLKNVTNRMIHLTNDAVQKKCEEYGKFENGNKVLLFLFSESLVHRIPKIS